MTPQKIAEQLGTNGLCVCPNFLSPLFLSEARNDLNDLYSGGAFKQAGIGFRQNHKVEQAIRQDQIYWYDSLPEKPIRRELLDQVESLRRAFNQTLFLGLNEFEGHYAVYSSGGFYKRHLDSVAKNNSRMVTIIIYLNEAWTSGDGGVLRIYDKDKYTDVPPQGGTLVCFLSKESEHEVLPSYSSRFSFTGWLKTGLS